jgi:hypothetical protein
LLLLVAGLGWGMVIASVFISLMPPTQGDAMSYHAPLAIFLWSDGHLSAFLDRSPDIWGLVHPGTAELWFGPLALRAANVSPTWGSFPLRFSRRLQSGSSRNGFLLALFGLGFPFLPWWVMLLRRRRRRQRPIGMAIVATAAYSRRSSRSTRRSFRFPGNQPRDPYDQVWGIDPVASSLPVRNGVLLNTGYGPGPSDYAAYYPLLGGSFRMRRVIVTDSSGANSSTAGIAPTMRRAHLRFAYASVVPSERTTVRAIYSPKYFRLVRDSGVVAGKKIAARRYPQPLCSLERSRRDSSLPV